MIVECCLHNFYLRQSGGPPMYTYPWYHWIMFFYIYCLCGWIFESTYVSIKERKPINRGFLRLPMLPIYGTGAVMMLWVSLPVQDNLVLTYLFGVIAATTLEYVTGFVMERLFKIKYWDYSNQRFHFQGYICLSSSIAWGFLTLLVVKVIHRPIATFVFNMNPLLECILLSIISVAFVIDVIKSVREALSLGRTLEAMTKLKAEAEEIQVQLALLKAETSQWINETKLRVNEIKNETSAKGEYIQSRIAQYTEENAHRVADLTMKLQETNEIRRKFSQNISLYRKGILLGNPTASSRKFAEALRELRDALNHSDDTSDM